MRKALLILILMAGMSLGGFAQTAGPMDVVVILDTSVGMSNYHWQTSDYLVGPFLREFLRIGDTFHLISFAETPRMEISRRIEGQGDVETIIGRLLLMYPLGSRSDVNSALAFAERYITGLPGNRPRKLLLISPGTPGTANLVSTASGRLANANAQLQFIQVPVTGDGPSSGRPIVAAAPPVTPPPA
ncbi:MAG: VWA domain-containing protein, partial [Treponema sp.]|nr:VWA domain-containing protein [Treponema sp.]